jgi:hypothetical protein
MRCAQVDRSRAVWPVIINQVNVRAPSDAE